MFVLSYCESVEKNTAEGIDEQDQRGVRRDENHLSIGTEFQMCPLEISFTFVFQHFERSLTHSEYNRSRPSMHRNALSRDCEYRTVR